MSDRPEAGGRDGEGYIDQLPLVGSGGRGEERANGITHAVAAVLSFVAVYELLFVAIRSRSFGVLLPLAVFSFTLLLLYVVSAFYHSLPRGRAKRLFRLLDHVAILYLIAGSYTAVLMLFLHGRIRWVMLFLEWGFAVAGTAFKVFFLGRFRGASMGLYLLMGWLAVIALPRFEALAVGELNLWLMLGGMCYMAGLIFFGARRLRYHHAVWHLFVIAGSAFHVIGIYEATKILYG